MGTGAGAGGFVAGDVKNYPGTVTRHVAIACVLGAMGGLSFGYDLGISGGVTSMASFLKKFFPDVYRKEALDTSTNQYCKYNSMRLTLFTSSLYLAALLASFGASVVTRKYGRKRSMLFGGIIFFIGACLNAGAVNLFMLIIGRLLLGVGVGFSNQSVPLYVSEMSPHKYRGAFNIVFQLAITIGIFIANLVNYLTPKIAGNHGWRYSLGGAAVPAALIFFSALKLDDTPNSLLEQGKSEEARQVLRKIRGLSDKEIEAEFQDLVTASEAAKQVEHPWRNIRKRQYRPQLSMAIAIPFFQQLTGMNVVMFYAPVLLQSIGFGNNASLLSAVITGAVNMLATGVSIYGSDKCGRRSLFLSGGAVMFVFQVVLAALIGSKFGTSGDAIELPKWYASLVVACICLFVSSFAWSWGPLGWLVPSEIFPLEIRSAGQSITVAVNMLFTFLIAQLFLAMLCHLKFGLFIFFAIFVGIMSAFVFFFLPETMNIPIEEMSKVWKQHPYWRRFMPEDDDHRSSDLTGFTKSLAITILSEVGDRTFCVAAILAMRYPRNSVLLGCLFSVIVMTVVSAFVGWAAPNLVRNKMHLKMLRRCSLRSALEEIVEAVLFPGNGRIISQPCSSFSSDSVLFGKDSQKMMSNSLFPKLLIISQPINPNLAFIRVITKSWLRLKRNWLANENDLKGSAGKSKVASKRDKNLKRQQKPFLTHFFSPTFLKLATISLAADEDTLAVVLGGILAQALCTVAAVLGGRSLASRISEKMGPILWARIGIT
ncbi:unnamed protein product [Dovyalis caffra]|uniref:Major facilitator superfamily (MFS) profile domain-containing protein n=1 Tax=Dovyalis caffra TaxID=77055 RepID=A0AAV1S4S2_9ROSI|nr:unnamed protein product [Dovyalis caffra]